MLQGGHCRYYEWDEDTFVMPSEYILKDKSDLADALEVFYLVGGFDFFNVVNPKYYASNWLDFVGNLYEAIVEGSYVCGSRQYIVPLSDVEKQELAVRGVPEVFITDIH